MFWRLGGRRRRLSEYPNLFMENGNGTRGAARMSKGEWRMGMGQENRAASQRGMENGNGTRGATRMSKGNQCTQAH